MSGSRLSPRPIVTAHLDALAGKNGHVSRLDLTRQYGLPAVGAGISCAVQWKMDTNVSVALLTISALLTAFTFELAISLHDRTLSLAADKPAAKVRTSQRASALKMLIANASYASLVAILATGAAIAATVLDGGLPDVIATGCTVACYVHLTIVLLLVLRRVFVDAATTLDRVARGEFAEQTSESRQDA